jgi:hypothetical protein
MALQRCTDLTPADWLLGTGTDVWQLLTFGPDVFEASSRLRFLPDPTAPGQSETDADVSEGYPAEADQGRDLLRVLTPFTTTPDRVFFAVWLGDGMSDDVPPGPTFDLPYREECALLVGDVRALDDETSPLAGRGGLPAMIWPEDRAWCVACDVDPHWAGIGGSPAAIRAVVDDPRLDAVPADPHAAQPTYDGWSDPDADPTSDTHPT